MKVRIPSLLTTADFSEAELSAMVLDGTLYRMGDCYCVIDQMPSVALRSGALAQVLPQRLIVERLTAAWVWGAVLDLPASYYVCVDIRSRVRPPATGRLVVREVVIADSEIVDFGVVRVTTPVRTALDLARSPDPFGEKESAALATLMHVANLTMEACEEAMNERRNLPNKKIALVRLRACAHQAARLPSVDERPGSDPLAVRPLSRAEGRAKN
jgi:hypothetical protein